MAERMKDLPESVQRYIAQQDTAKGIQQAKARRAASHTPGVMNGLESRYAAYLDLLVKAHQIRGYRFEWFPLVLPADRCTLTVDFFIVMRDGSVQLHDTKPRKKNGRYFCHEDAWLKLKLAAREYAWLGEFYVVWPGEAQSPTQWDKQRIES